MWQIFLILLSAGDISKTKLVAASAKVTHNVTITASQDSLLRYEVPQTGLYSIELVSTNYSKSHLLSCSTAFTPPDFNLLAVGDWSSIFNLSRENETLTHSVIIDNNVYYLSSKGFLYHCALSLCNDRDCELCERRGSFNISAALEQGIPSFDWLEALEDIGLLVIGLSKGKIALLEVKERSEPKFIKVETPFGEGDTKEVYSSRDGLLFVLRDQASGIQMLDCSSGKSCERLGNLTGAILGDDTLKVTGFCVNGHELAVVSSDSKRALVFDITETLKPRVITNMSLSGGDPTEVFIREDTMLVYVNTANGYVIQEFVRARIGERFKNNNEIALESALKGVSIGDIYAMIQFNGSVNVYMHSVDMDSYKEITKNASTTKASIQNLQTKIERIDNLREVTKNGTSYYIGSFGERNGVASLRVGVAVLSCDLNVAPIGVYELRYRMLGKGATQAGRVVEYEEVVTIDLGVRRRDETSRQPSKYLVLGSFCVFTLLLLGVMYFFYKRSQRHKSRTFPEEESAQAALATRIIHDSRTQ
eukprot:TRINITY_DN8896_c0_g1_i1.p1 TRINITY_DN8896_c0_g1~~TRINITY_DN8896_c0_g1_i1.p1  ORF type:complete len:534 (+),score=91.20 TRINITY_DN8896_c0_g1_i1:163-1764(+)